MISFLNEVISDFKNLSSLKKITYVLVPLGALSLTAVQIAMGFVSLDNEMDKKKHEIEIKINEANKLAKEVARELINSPDFLPPLLRNGIKNLDMVDIVSDVSFDNLDMDLRVTFRPDDSYSVIEGSDCPVARIDTEVSGYAPGQYKTTPVTVHVIAQIIEKVFYDKLKGVLGNLHIKIDVTGLADCIKVKNDTVYKGEPIENVRYYNINEQREKVMNLVPYESKRTNERIAFLRAYHLYNSLKYIDIIGKSSARLCVREVDEPGTRKAIMAMNIYVEDALKDVRKELGFIEKVIFDYKYQ